MGGAMRMECSTTRSYDVALSSDVLDPDNPVLAEVAGSKRGLVILDSCLEAEHGPRLKHYLATRLPGFETRTLVLSEHAKSIETVMEICATAQAMGLGRQDLLVAVGGGICCDLVSVAASLIRRGVPYVTVPTTLLAQVDAGIALKGGVNFGGSKNYLGCFRPPAAVLVDPMFLLTVHRADLVSGMAEMLKIGLVRDAQLVAELRAHGPLLASTGFAEPAGVGFRLIGRSIELMLGELAANPYEERGLRRLVDFGHTFSGRLEEASAYALRHGEAVALDMALSSAIALETGHLTGASLVEILTTLLELDLPVSSDLATQSNLVEAIAATANHRAGALNLVVPAGIGTATFLPSVTDV
ncbi:MAG: 2-epi-5-epi-valiolone synthase, partial [Nocardioidaceae bacterium]|nr:2-epi-5-epi-valiolone synthase [Nocardioidaceae bacterium]